jgi:peroxiredoxin
VIWSLRADREHRSAPAELQDVTLNVFKTDVRTQTADGSWRLPIPATFVIDETGVVRAAHVSPDFRERLEPGAVLAALEALE